MSVHDAIKVATFIDPQDPFQGTHVQSHLDRTDLVYVSSDEASQPKVIEHAKWIARRKTLDFLYGDLIEPIRELEHIVRMSPNADIRRLVEIRKLIDAVIGPQP